MALVVKKRCPARLSKQTLICHDPVVSRQDLAFWTSAATGTAVPGRMRLNEIITGDTSAAGSAPSGSAGEMGIIFGIEGVLLSVLTTA